MSAYRGRDGSGGGGGSGERLGLVVQAQTTYTQQQHHTHGQRRHHTRLPLVRSVLSLVGLAPGTVSMVRQLMRRVVVVCAGLPLGVAAVAGEASGGGA